MLHTCCFEYADGTFCEEPVMPETFGPISEMFKGRCQDSGNEVVRAHFPTTSHSTYCLYHQKMMEGRIYPVDHKNIPRKVLNEIQELVKERELVITTKKLIEARRIYHVS